MILHHIAHSTRRVIISTATINRDGLGDGDLDIVDIMIIPKRLEQNIGKAHGHQVLYGFFTQIMVDTVDLPLIKVLGQNLV